MASLASSAVPDGRLFPLRQEVPLDPALAASWYGCFIASASYARGPAYQLQAMLCAVDETRLARALLACSEAPAFL